MNPSRSRLLFDLPSCYRIRMQGPLGAGAIRRLNDMTTTMGRVTARQQVTTLTCEVCDQAALRAVLDLLYDMGLPLLKVERLGPPLPADDSTQVAAQSEQAAPALNLG